MPPTQEHPYLTRLRARRDTAWRNLVSSRPQHPDGIPSSSNFEDVSFHDRDRVPPDLGTVDAIAGLETSPHDQPSQPLPPFSIHGHGVRPSRRHSFTAHTQRQEPTQGPLPATAFVAEPWVFSSSANAFGNGGYTFRGRSHSMSETILNGKHTSTLASVQLQHELAEYQMFLLRTANPGLYGREARIATIRSKILRCLTVWVLPFILRPFFAVRHTLAQSWQWVKRTISFPSMANTLWALWWSVIFNNRPRILPSMCELVPNTTWTSHLCNYSIIPFGTHEPLTFALANTNDALAVIMSQSIQMRVLPYLIQMSNSAMTQLSVLAKYSQLEGRARLEAECDRFYREAEESNYQLMIFFVRINMLTEHMIRDTNSTINVIRTLHTDVEAQCNTASWMAKLRTNVLSPVLGISPACSVAVEPIVAELSGHLNIISPDINEILTDSPSLIDRFGDLQKRMANIQKLALIGYVGANQQRDTIIEQRPRWKKIWINLGGPSLDKSGSWEKEILTLQQVPEYLHDAQQVIAITVVSLRDMSVRLDYLRKKLTDAEAKRIRVAQEDLPSAKDLDELQSGMKQLVVLHDGIKVRQAQQLQDVLIYRKPKGALDDYRITKAGGKIKYVLKEDSEADAGNDKSDVLLD